MKSFFHNLSIKAKLISIIASISTLAIIAGFSLVIINDIQDFKKQLMEEVHTLGLVASDNLSSALAFTDKAAAEDAIKALSSQDFIKNIVVYDQEGNVFIQLHDPQHQMQAQPWSNSSVDHYDSDFLHTFENIFHNKNALGHLYIRSSTASLDKKIQRRVLALFIILSLAIVISIVLTMRFQRFISNPILYLTKVIKKISATGDYNHRVHSDAQDEIGYLYVGFNSLLDQIHKRQEERDQAQRSLEVANAELEEAKAKAESATESKSHFLASMSHEIRTPLNGLVSLIDLVLDSNLDEEQRIDLETMQTTAHSLRTLINDILDFSKIEAGKLYITKTAFSLEKCINNSIIILETVAANKQQTLVSEVRGDLPSRLIGDSLRIQQVITNLIGNAIKFTPEKGAVLLFVNVHEIVDNIAKIQFTVADSGIGIPKDKIEQIFESFTQADSSTEKKYGGTGLGLTISKLLVDMMGGEIWVNSIPEVGTAFHFNLEFELEAKASEKKADKDEDKTKKSLKVLLAEDNEINQDTMARILKRQGHQVQVVNNGAEALEAFKEDSFDIFLTDLQMPKMGGIEVTRHIRNSQASYSRIPIIVVTACAVKEMHEACLNAGANGIVTKPIDFEKLLSLMEQA